MRIPFNSVIDLLRTEYKVLTKKEFLKVYHDLIEKSFKTAELIEDYEFLSVMTGENDKYDNYVIVFNEGPQSSHLPFILEQNNDLTLMGIAKLSCDTSIPKESFYQLIDEVASGNEMDPTSLYYQFDVYVRKIKELRDLSMRKIGRNDPCPCKSGKKYKFCCGIGIN